MGSIGFDSKKPAHRTLQREIVAVLIDRFNDMLIDVTGEFAGFAFHVDCRDSVGSPAGWYDELHPREPGFKRAAARFAAKIDELRGRHHELLPSGAEPRCPGYSKRIEDAQDLSDGAFARLVARRQRQLPKTPSKRDGEDLDRHEAEADISRFHEKIDLDSELLPSAFLSTGADRARAVCRIRTPLGFGSGFLVASRGFVMTNHHVLENREQAAVAVAEFGFEEGGQLQRVSLLPERFFLTNEALDYTIVACDGASVGDVTPIPLLRNPATVSRFERVNIIQHPRGRRKEVAIRENKVERILDKVVRYRTDTEPGSSGSCVFNDDWQPVALHHAGWMEGGGRAINEGVRMAAIVADLIARQRDESSGSAEIDQLVHSIPDSSPYLGFFDIAGVCGGADPSEIEVPDFQGTADFADLGFWNIEHFNDQVSDRRVDDVADVLHRLNMDVMGLTEVEQGAMERLVTALRARGDDVAFELLDVPLRQDIAVLYDRETTQVTLANDLSERHRDAIATRTPDGRTAFPRAPLFARCTVAGGNDEPLEFLLIVVHLKAFFDAQSRARRRLAAGILAEIIQDIRETERLPVVLGGDMNEKLNNDVLAALRDSPDLFALTADDAVSGAASYIGGSRRSLIDHIVVSRDLQLGSIAGDDAAIVRLDRSVRDFADRASDHVPVVMRLVNRDDPIVIDPPDDDPETHALAIPAGATQTRVSFE